MRSSSRIGGNVKTLYRIIALILLTPIVIGAAMFVGAFIALIGLIGSLCDVESA